MDFNPVQTFHACSIALDSLAKKQEPPGQENIPPDVRLSKDLSGTEIVARVELIVRKLFANKMASEVLPGDWKAFLERWTHWVESSKQGCLQKKAEARSRLVELLFGEPPLLGPFEIIEVLRDRSAASLTRVEIIALARSLFLISTYHRKFKRSLYAFYAMYFNSLWRLKLSNVGAQLKFGSGLDFLCVDWTKIPLYSLDAVVVASLCQNAEEKDRKEDLLRQILPDAASFSEECKKVLSICAMDFLWHTSSDIYGVLWSRASLTSAKDCEYGLQSLHPAVSKAMAVLDDFWRFCGKLAHKENSIFETEMLYTNAKGLVETLLLCTKSYNEVFHKTASLYERGYSLYMQVPKAFKGFIVSDAEFAEPREFSEDTLPVVDLAQIDANQPTTLEAMTPLVLSEKNDRVKVFFSIIFQPEAEARKALDYFLSGDQVKKERHDLPPSEYAAGPLHSEKLNLPAKKREKSPSCAKKKKASSSVRQCTAAFQQMSLSSPSLPSSSESLVPAVSGQAQALRVSSRSCPLESVVGTTTKKVDEVVLKGRSTPLVTLKKAPSISGPWLTPTCLEGEAAQILEGLSLPQVRLHWHVKRLLVTKAEASGALPWEVQCHTYPTIIARIIQKFTEPRSRFSQHRNASDNTHSCVGTWHEYGKKKKPVLGRFTEAFFGKDSQDGKMGELFHHCFFQDLSGGCIARFQRNGVYHSDEDIEEILNNEKGCFDSVGNPHARFQVTLGPFSCTVDDKMEEIRYTLGFSRKIL